MRCFAVANTAQWPPTHTAESLDSVFDAAKLAVNAGKTIVKKTLRNLLEESFAEQRASIEQLRADMTLQITGLRTVVSQLDQKVDRMDVHLTATNGRLKLAEDRIQLLAADVRTVQNRVDTILTRSETLQSDVTAIRGGILGASQLEHRLSRLEDRVFAKAS
jgi:DNA repair ATPase RecN